MKLSSTRKTVKMLLERETKGAVRYMEVGTTGQQLELADALIGTLYIRKAALSGHIPDAIYVTICDELGKDA